MPGALSILQRLEVVPYGVLGKQLARNDEGRNRVKEHSAGPPGARTVFCDPTGLSFIRNGPRRAGGASGEIYDFLDIKYDPSFPEPVRAAVTSVSRAKYHAYAQDGGGALHCIHVVGPDFSGRDGGFTRDEAQQELAAAYKNVLCEFHAAASGEGGLKELRLLPISGGIFAGRFKDEIATLTMDALGAATTLLSPEVSDFLLQSDGVQLHLCIFVQDELAAFQEAHRLAALPPEEEEKEEEEEEEEEEHRMLLIGATDVGKSSLINRFTGELPHLPDGTENPKYARTKVPGSGSKGTTARCRTYRVDPKPEWDNRALALVDSIGVGTTSGEGEGEGESDLIADLEWMAKNDEKFHAILFCVKATDEAAGLAEMVKRVLQYGFLKGKAKMGENVILVGMRADLCRGFPEENFGEDFQNDVVPGFFTEDCFGSGAAALLKNFAYTYYPADVKVRRPPCSDICIDGLRDKLKTTPNWIHFDDLTDDDLLDFNKETTDEQIALMCEPLLRSTVSKERKERILNCITEKVKEQRAKIELLEQEKADAAEKAEKKHANFEAAQRRSAQLGHLKHDEVRAIGRELGIWIGSSAACNKHWVEALRQLKGNTYGPTAKDWVAFIVDKEFPDVGWLAIAAAGYARADTVRAPRRRKGGARGGGGGGGGASRPAVRLLTMRAQPGPRTPRVAEPAWWHNLAPKADLDVFGEKVRVALAGGANVFEAEASGRTVLHEAIWRNSLPAVEAITAHADEREGRLGELLHTGCMRGETAASLINDRSRSCAVAKHVRKLLKKHPARGSRAHRSVTPGSSGSVLPAEDAPPPPTVKKRKGKSTEEVPVKVLDIRVQGIGHQYECKIEGGGKTWLAAKLIKVQYPQLVAAFNAAPAAAAGGEEEDEEGEAEGEGGEAAAAAAAAEEEEAEDPDEATEADQPAPPPELDPFAFREEEPRPAKKPKTPSK